MVMAYVQLNAGNIDKALDYLEDVLSIPSPYSTAWVEMDARWELTRDHPRYREIMAKYEGIEF
jgi:hypothetical protein